MGGAAPCWLQTQETGKKWPPGTRREGTCAAGQFPENEADRTAMVSLDPSSILYMNYSLYSVRNKNFATYDIIRDYRDYNPSDIYFVAGTLIGFEMLNLDFFQMASDNLDGYFNMLDEMRSCSRK